MKFIRKKQSGKRQLRSEAVAQPAFSLVEMLMALLVASLLLAALAPVITKRAGVESIRVSGSNQSVNPILDEEGFECFNQPNTVVTRSNRVPGVLHIIMVSGGGGGGSASKGSESGANAYVAASATTSKSLASPIVVTQAMASATDLLDVSLVGGGGGGGGAVAYGVTTSSSQNKTEGDKTETTPAQSGCPSGSSLNSTNNQCVYAVTTSSANWTGANNACKTLTLGGATAGSWRLPTKDEITGRWTKSKPTGLVTDANYWSSGSCSGSCSGGSAHYSPYLTGSGSWNTSVCTCDIYSKPYRCVLPTSTTIITDTTVNYTEYTTTQTLKSFSAAAGGAAPGFSSLKSRNAAAYQAFQNAVKNNVGGKITITAGGGGTAGVSRASRMTGTGNTTATNGTAGKESCLVVSTASGANAFKVCAKGGAAGSGVTNISNVANTTITTNAAAAQTSNGCYYQVGTSAAVYFACDGGVAGTSGTSNYNSQSKINRDSALYITANTTSGRTAGGAGYTIPALSSGAAGSGTYGAGGYGAGSYIALTASGGFTYTYTGTAYAPTAGNPGFGRIVYGSRFEGNPGAGGAGGTLAVEHINTRGSNIEFQVKVGAGGVGGAGGASVGSANGNPGTAGGNTTFKVIDNTNGGMEVANYTVYGGGGGAAGRNDGVLATGGVPNPAGGLNLTAGSSFTTKNGGFILGIKGDDANNTDKTGGYGGTSGLSAGTTNAPNFRYQGGTSTTGWNGPGWDTTGSVGVPIGGITVDALRGASRDKFPSQAGWGGGGGGFDLSSGLSGVGSGGNGMPGYVCAYWLNGQWE